MERLSSLVKELNMYERSKVDDKEIALIKKQILINLSKSQRFYHVYQLIKDKKLGLNYYLLPYRVLKDSNENIIYELKTIEKFKQDYPKSLIIIETLYRDKEIDKKTYAFLKKSINNMFESFAKEFNETKLDKLNIKEKTKYYIYKKKIEKFYNDYISSIGQEAFYNKIKNYAKNSCERRYKLLERQNEELANLLNIINVKVHFKGDEYVSYNRYIINEEDVKECSFDVLTKEQVYKLVCAQLIYEKEDIRIVDALLEDVDFIKENISKRKKCVKVGKKL